MLNHHQDVSAWMFIIQMMKGEGQAQRELEGRRLWGQFASNVEQVLEGKSSGLSYQLAYDTVYKLTKQQRQPELLAFLDERLAQLFRRQAALVERSLPALNQLLASLTATATRLSEICLFLDVNYCQKELNCPLKRRLADTLFRTLATDSPTLAVIAEGLVGARRGKTVATTGEECSALLQAVGELDEREEFFEKYLLNSLVPLEQKHYRFEAGKKWEEGEVANYLEWCRQQLEAERDFMRRYLVRKRGQEGVEAVIAAVYAEIVHAYKPRIYAGDEQQLFEKLTLIVLELLKFGGSREVEGHVQWFMGGIERRLNALPTADNEEFLGVFCSLFAKVAALLQNTQGKFDINYRSVFAFQEWINNEKFNLPLRLNLLLDHHLTAAVPLPATFAANALLLFRLVKQKALFEQLLRKMLISRLIHRYATHPLERELKLIDAMEAECGEEWTKKIKSICTLFSKNRQEQLATRKIEPNDEKLNWSAGGLLPVVVEENDWPYEEKTTKVVLHPQLAQLVPPFEAQYLPQNKNHRLVWSPKLGMATLAIRFSSTTRTFLLTLPQANLLLTIQTTPAQLAHYLCNSGYKLDEVQSGLQSLIEAKLVISTPKGSDVLLQLAANYEAGEMVDLARGKRDSKVQVRAMEELKADRKLMVEAIVVKLMKSEKVAKRSDLVQRTAPLLAQRGFNFNADFVEKSIDRLLDKEFLRDLQDGSLGYIA